MLPLSPGLSQTLGGTVTASRVPGRARLWGQWGLRNSLNAAQDLAEQPQDSQPAQRCAQSHSSSTTVNTPEELCFAQETSTPWKGESFWRRNLNFWCVGWSWFILFWFGFFWGSKIKSLKQIPEEIICLYHSPSLRLATLTNLLSYVVRHHSHHNQLLALLSCSGTVTPTIYMRHQATAVCTWQLWNR